MKKLSIFLWTLLAPLSVYAVTSLAELNPLNTSSLHVVIGRLIRALLGLSGAVALLMFVWGGFLWLTSRGEPAQVTKGKETLKWATIGLVVIFTAYTLVNLVINALTTGNVLQTSSPAAQDVEGVDGVNFQAVCSDGSEPQGTGLDGQPICN